MEIGDKIKAIKAIARHSSRNAAKLPKGNYEFIEDFGKELNIPKYRKSLFRGIGLHRGGNAAAVKVAHGILADKSFKLSSFTGAQRYAESWSKSPSAAKDFAKDNPFGAILESRPLPKDIVIDLSDNRFRDFDFKKIVDETVTGALAFSMEEKEVVVRTGNRKYSLCRNIVYFVLDANVMREGWKTLPQALSERLKNNRHFQLELDTIDRWTTFRFACKGGKLVYLPGNSEESDWFSKLESR